jgi:hypothetical protein
MHMIPAANPAGRFVELPDGPQLLAAKLWGADIPPETVRQRAAQWIASVVRPVRNASVAFEAVAWAMGRPVLTNVLAAGECLALCEKLSSLPADADELLLREDPLLHQLLAVELPWTLAGRSFQSKYDPSMEQGGRKAIALGLSRIIDRQGMLPAEHIRQLRPLLACWTRCRALAAKLPGGPLGPQPEQRFQRFLRNALRLNLPDGRAMFADDGSPAITGSSKGRSLDGRPSKNAASGRDLFEAALNSGVDEGIRRLGMLAPPKLLPNAVARRPDPDGELPPPSIYFEEGGIAVMRRNWHGSDERPGVLFAGQTCELAFVASGRLAMSGAWQFEISQHGRQLEPVTNWESTCWYTDKEVDFLELEIELAGGVFLQRQLVLARDDRFLFLADAVLSPQPGDLQYRSVLPLAAGIEFRGAHESREGLLVDAPTETRRGKPDASARPLAQVLPLGMPEWRAEPSPGELCASADGLELKHHSTGQRLFVPLFLDLDRKRFRRRMTWRRLTVAESLAIVPPEKAVGFRVAIGSEQWLFYRSLAPAANRTVLGHNLSSESLFARFGKNGAVTSIVEIE